MTPFLAMAGATGPLGRRRSSPRQTIVNRLRLTKRNVRLPRAWRGRFRTRSVNSRLVALDGSRTRGSQAFTVELPRDTAHR